MLKAFRRMGQELELPIGSTGSAAEASMLAGENIVLPRI